MAWNGSTVRGSPYAKRSDESSGKPSVLSEAPTIAVACQFPTPSDDSQLLPVSSPRNAYHYIQHVNQNPEDYNHNADLHPPVLNGPMLWHFNPSTIEDAQETTYGYNSFHQPGTELSQHQQDYYGGYQIEPHGLSTTGARVNTSQQIGYKPMEFTEAIEADYLNLTERQPVQPHATVQRDTLHRLLTSQLPTNSRVPISRGPPMSTNRDESSQGTSERRFTCDVPGCGVACKREADLQRHKKCKHGLGTVIYQCNDCTFVNARKDKMMDHEKVTTHSYQITNFNQPTAT